MKLRLLPNKFKWVGIGVILLSIFLLVVLKWQHNNFFAYKNYVKSFALIGFCMLIFSKQKIEDEFVTLKRLQAFFFAFIVLIGNIILSPLLPLENFQTPYKIAFQICIQYLLWFYLSILNWFNLLNKAND
jgi:hypothetical protein